MASESTATSAAVNEAPSSAAPAAATAETAAESPPAAPAQPVAKRKPAPQSTTWVTKTPVPSIRGELPPELQQEVDEALGGLSLDEVLEPGQKQQVAADLEPESRHQAKIVSIHNDDVFVELGGRNQGVLSLRQFPDATDVGQVVEVVVVRFDPEEGLYQLTLPNSAIVAANWGDITEGVIVEARVTGHNKGGLECEVNNIRAFIPASQIDVYRVEDLAQFVGQKFPAVVTEARRSAAIWSSAGGPSSSAKRQPRRNECSTSWPKGKFAKASCAAYSRSVRSLIWGASTACCTSASFPGNG